MCIEETQKFNELDPIYKEFSEYENYEKELINSYAEMDNDYTYQWSIDNKVKVRIISNKLSFN